MKSVLKDARTKPEALSAILVSGGSVGVAALAAALESLLGRASLDVLDPAVTVACGAVQARTLADMRSRAA